MEADSSAIIWGAAGHAKVVADILTLTDRRIAGFVDDIDPSRAGAPFSGSTILGGAGALADCLDRGINHAIVAFGDNRARLRAADVLLSHGFTLINAIHPSATIARDVQIGSGTVIAASATVNPGTLIGSNAIINTHASVDHDCIIGDGAHIGPNATLAGAVQIETCAWIAAAAVVIDKRTVGADAIVGAGSVVLDDVAARTIVVGIPARYLRKLPAKEIT